MNLQTINTLFSRFTHSDLFMKVTQTKSVARQVIDWEHRTQQKNGIFAKAVTVAPAKPQVARRMPPPLPVYFPLTSPSSRGIPPAPPLPPINWLKKLETIKEEEPAQVHTFHVDPMGLERACSTLAEIKPYHKPRVIDPANPKPKLNLMEELRFACSKRKKPVLDKDIRIVFSPPNPFDEPGITSIEASNPFLNPNLKEILL